MIEYIYIVKCPNCEDEHFYFFDEAKTCAMDCLSNKPIITQVEVCRNDFGECTEHSDLGTVWSWEDIMEKPVSNEAVFTKDDLKEYDPDNDPEFADDDFFAINQTESLDELAEHVNEEHPAIESEQELHGIDNAVVDCKVAKVVTHSEDEKPVDCEGKKKPLEKSLTEKTHAKYAKPEGDRIAAFNNALTYAKKDGVPYIYGYTGLGNKFFALEQPIKVAGDISEKEAEFKSRYKNCQIIHVAYPSKSFVEEGLSISELVEAMEENEDNVECKVCYGLFPKTDCLKQEHGYVCSTCGRPATAYATEVAITDAFNQDFPEVDEYDESSVNQELVKLVVDEFEAIEGYDSTDELIQHSRLPEEEKEKILDTLEHIREEEEEHIDELKALITGDKIEAHKEESLSEEISDDDLTLIDETVECAGCEETFDKEACFYDEERGWLCPDCEDHIVKCTWCNDLYDKSECRYEVDLGWLCDRCEAAIKSRGETLTFSEGNYWDFLDEDFDGEYSEADIEAIAADIVNGARELIQDSPVTDDVLVEDTVEIGGRNLRGVASWLERVKLWFRIKVISLFIKNKNLYDRVCDSINGHLVKDAIADLIHVLQQLDWELLEENALAAAKKQGLPTDGLALKVYAKESFLGGYREEVFVDRVLTRIRDGKAKDIFDSIQQLDDEMFEYDLVPESTLE